MLLLPALAISAASGEINLSTPSRPAIADIPPAYLLLYQQAGLAFEIPWEILAAIGKLECDHGRHPHPACWRQGAVNRAGAGGPMQFLAGTWAAYGIDADQDGLADRWNPADAIVSAANYLAASGAPERMEAAIYAYNPSRRYLALVLAWSEHYQEAAASGCGFDDYAPSPIYSGANIGAVGFQNSYEGLGGRRHRAARGQDISQLKLCVHDHVHDG